MSFETKFSALIITSLLSFPITTQAQTPPQANAQQTQQISKATQDAIEALNGIDYSKNAVDFAIRILKEKLNVYSQEQVNTITNLDSRVHWWEDCVSKEVCWTWIKPRIEAPK